MKPIGERIKEIRQSKGISQTIVAETCGIKQSSYANIENGKTQNITIEIGKGIARALDVSFIELFDIAISDKYFDGYKADLESITEAYSDLDETVKELLERIKEKDLLIETLKNEKSHVRQHLVMQLVSNFTFDVNFISNQIANTKDEKEKAELEKKKDDVVRVFNLNKDYYIKTGFLSNKEFDDYFEEIKDLDRMLRSNDRYFI
ncbi:helix-turn-helix domain-containing protein [Gaoshiqia sediminis]|uniref:Helix-turn-helix domain-containing protein n=1 Tax=Gaoshiqia sediminis TaxID=2986998 RepID=A0AA41Y7P7_9BACT|nr:helix-turn-helix transcriptional regulator [Gaoshiqia sediminis]MCW0483504.1 helix-turn-helix domain-containing protein [Gaoshiqia sediminis]